jgi:hypothetical protein
MEKTENTFPAFPQQVPLLLRLAVCSLSTFCPRFTHYKAGSAFLGPVDSPATPRETFSWPAGIAPCFLFA